MSVRAIVPIRLRAASQKVLNTHNHVDGVGDYKEDL